MVNQGIDRMPGIGSDIADPDSVESAYAETPLAPLLTMVEAAGEFQERFGRVTCPVLIITSVQDHVVDPVNSDVLATRSRAGGAPPARTQLPRGDTRLRQGPDRVGHGRVRPQGHQRLTRFTNPVGQVGRGARWHGCLRCPTMAERITRDDVAHVARLARLALTDDELDMFTDQLAKVLDHAADVEALDVADVPPTVTPVSRCATCCVPTSSVRPSTVMRCWPRRLRSRTTGSRSRRSSSAP